MAGPNSTGNLSQLCWAKKLPQPNYVHHQRKGKITVSCTLLSFKEIGVGTRGKLAKRAAEHKMLRRMLSLGLGLGPETEDPSLNPVSSLWTICTSRCWPHPTYNVVKVKKSPRTPVTTVSCSLFQLKEMGAGRDKKIAKRKAAAKMLQIVQKLEKREGHKVVFFAGLQSCDGTIVPLNDASGPCDAGFELLRAKHLATSWALVDDFTDADPNADLGLVSAMSSSSLEVSGSEVKLEENPNLQVVVKKPVKRPVSATHVWQGKRMKYGHGSRSRSTSAHK